MNRIETIVYNTVRKNPALKQAVRNMYQGVFDLLPKKKDYFKGDLDYKEGYFFGFHDVSPLSEDETKLLAMHNFFDFRMPDVKEVLEVGYFDFKDGRIWDWHKLDDSFAWNYHKGCRFQWVDNANVIFNTAVKGRLGSKIINVNSKKATEYEYPIDAVFWNGNKRVASSFSYERLDRCMPGYGYPYKDDGVIDEAAPETTGLFLLDLNNGKRKLILSVHDIAMQVTGKIESEYLHFVTHTEFSKDGQYIAFLYRRIPKVGDYMKRRSVICVYSFADNRLIVLPSQESGSHYVWNSLNQIIASCNIDGKNCHALFDLNDIDEVRLIDSEHLNSDGHQSFINDQQFVTDTYPDKFRMAKLYKADIPSNTSELIATMYSPKKFQTKDFQCHIACDLHPRVIGNGKYICFDSVRTGKRSINVMKL